QVTQFRVDESVEPIAGIGGRLPVDLEKLEVVLARHPHGERAGDPGRRMLPLDQPGTDLRLCLSIVQHHHAVGVGEVVGGADLLLLVPLIAQVEPSEPGTGASLASVAEMGTGLELLPVRPHSDLETTARGARFEPAVANGAGHEFSFVSLPL